MSDGYLKIEGRNAYVVTQREWAGTIVHHWLVLADSLVEARRMHGWTRQMHTSRSVRRARQSDAELPLRNS